jgi:hypothetical protein
MFKKMKVYPPTKLKPYWLIRYSDGSFEIFKTLDKIPLKLRKKLNL